MWDSKQHSDELRTQYECQCDPCKRYYLSQIDSANCLGIFPGLASLIVSRGGLNTWDVPFMHINEW